VRATCAGRRPRSSDRRRIAPWSAAVSLALWALAAALAVSGAAAAAVAAPALPPLSHGGPATLRIGLTSSPGGAAGLRGLGLGFRYQYLAGGVGTGKGWETWDPDGSFVSRYVAESRAAGLIPVFSYYMLLQSNPQGSEAEADLRNLRDPRLMELYRADLELFFRRAAGRSPVVLHVEPDFWGYAEQAATGDDARTVPGVVALAQEVRRLRDRLAPNVLLAYHLSGWGTKEDITYSKPPAAHVDALARRAARFYRSLGVDFDLVFTDWADRDAGFEQKVNGDDGTWWRAADFERARRFVETFVHASGKRVVVWQVPLGNTLVRSLDDTWGHFQDNRVQWVLQRRHLAAYARSGVIGFLFGGGADGTTCACDARGDGVTNPPPIDGNTRVATSADDDGGLFRELARAYARSGPIRLPGA